MNWNLHSLDIKSAFLQGLPIGRELYLKPPKCANTSSLWLLHKPPYGLVDACRHFYLRVCQELLSLGLSQNRFDKAVFHWYYNGKLAGVIASHVDDFIYGGTPQFHVEIISKIRNVFAIGLEEETNLKYIGLQIDQCSIGITLSTKSYAESLSQIELKCKTEKDRKLSQDQLLLLKKLCGQLNWLCTQSRPDICYENCVVANSQTNATVRDIYYANKVVRKLHSTDFSLCFNGGINLHNCNVVTFCDASFGNLPNGGSQGAFFTFLIDSNGMYSPIDWQSRRLKRVVKSTVAAECLAAIEAAENVVLLSTALKTILNDSECSIRCLIYCDNKNLVNAVHSSTKVEDQRLQIDVCVLRNMISNGELSKFYWVPTTLQIANCLTKQGASVYDMLNVLNKKT